MNPAPFSDQAGGTNRILICENLNHLLAYGLYRNTQYLTKSKGRLFVPRFISSQSSVAHEKWAHRLAGNSSQRDIGKSRTIVM